MSARVIEEEMYAAKHPTLGGPVLILLPTIPDDAPYRIREGIARQRIAATTGRCPCGARATYYGEAGAVGVGEVYHQRRCPASSGLLGKAIRRWRA